jgi:hypothetical protein
MDIYAEKFLRYDFQTMSIFAALGRSNTYSASATEQEKNAFRSALRKKLDELSKAYITAVSDETHLSNITNLSDDLTAEFSRCLERGRLRIGIAQKALNLYLKYLWCANLIVRPPHCPFDSIVIRRFPDCRDLSWTSIDSMEEYNRLVNAAKQLSQEQNIAQWELEIWISSLGADKDDNKTMTPLQISNTKRKSQNGFGVTATKYHDNFKLAMAGHIGKRLKTSQIKTIIQGIPQLAPDAAYIYPSDHCINHGNKGNCECARTEQAIFERIDRGIYLVRRT